MTDALALPGGRRPPALWRFGQATLDEQVAGLRVAGLDVPLDRSSYDVLLALLRHAGEVVTKDELLDAGWPGRVVSENSLAKAISRLRQALGAEGAAIRAVHGYGYRLIADVSVAPVTGGGVAPNDADRLREGDSLPHRPGWTLGPRLGQGGAGVIFQTHAKGHPVRVVKFATGEHGLRSLKREIALARYIRAVRRELADVAPVLDWNLSHPPYFLELPFFPDGHLGAWAAARGGLQSLDAPARLELCARLCDAVAALHEIGVIHSDLKPQNLYPVADPEGGWHVVLADLGAGDTAQGNRLAELGITMSVMAADLAQSQRAGSLLYMAPEVIAGEVPTQRSDVFALGTLVYQMMVGDLRSSLAPGWESNIQDTLLREDIALAAAANPERRHIDARALAIRLRSLEARHLAADAEHRLAVESARQVVQLARMTRRRRQLLAGSALLSAVLALSVWQQWRTGQARAGAEVAARLARAEAAKTRGVVTFLTDGVLKQADPYSGKGGAVTLHEAIDRAALDVDARFQRTPDVAAAIHGTLGAVYEGRNDFPRAVQQFDKQVAALRRAQPVDRAAIARAGASLCTAWIWQGDLDHARPACERAHDDYVAAGLAPDRPDVFLALADSREGNFRRTVERLQPRLEPIRRSGDNDLLGHALWFSASADVQLGDLARAERTFAELTRVRRRQAGASSMQLAWALSEHGHVLLMLGRTREGKARLAQSIEMFDAVGGQGHPHGYAPRIHLAQHALALGQWRQASAMATPAFQSLRAKTGWQNWTIYAALVAMAADAELGNHAAARRLMADFRAMAGIEGLDRDFKYLREAHWTGFAAAHLALGEPAEAARYGQQLASLSAQPDASPLLVAKVACIDGRIALLRGDARAAHDHAQACRQRLRAVLPPASPLLALPDRLLGETAGRAGLP
jgi:non-specific serine/threonine protein kinase